MDGAGDSSSCIKHKSGKPLRSGEKTIVLNVFDALCVENPSSTLNEIAKSTAHLTGVSVSSVHRARQERAEKGCLTTPGKKRPRKRPVTKLDEFLETAIRRKVHNLFFINELPTINKVLSAVNIDEDLPTYKRSTFHLILKQIGFDYVKRNQGTGIKESESDMEGVEPLLDSE